MPLRGPSAACPAAGGQCAESAVSRLGMLLPLVFPAVLLPPLLKWVSGNAAGRASAAYQATTARTVIAGARTSP
jgi:hypothetical protein